MSGIRQQIPLSELEEALALISADDTPSSDRDTSVPATAGADDGGAVRTAPSVRSLSMAALRTAAATVSTMHSGETTELLYHANWLPFSPQWSRKYQNVPAVTNALFSDTATAELLRTGWRSTTEPYWVHWSPLESAHRGYPRYKLYVSVLPDELLQTFPSIVSTLFGAGCPPFKVSGDPRSLLRPDRLVIYVHEFDAMERLGRELNARVGHLPYQGVPFTATFDASDAVTWGSDPPRAQKSYASSWRRWVCRKLSGYLHASDSDAVDERVTFTLDHLRHDGVDIDRWCRQPQAAHQER
jgi:hypothetical protein